MTYKYSYVNYYKYAPTCRVNGNGQEYDDFGFSSITDVIPAEIDYPNGHYRVRFGTTTRSDYDTAWGYPLGTHYYIMFQASLLSDIYIEQDATLDGTFETIIRQYHLTYETVSASKIFPGVTWPAGGQTPTLIKISEYGAGGSGAPGAAPLPETTFSYNTDKMHLSSANNGYGGEVDFEYAPWHEMDATQDATTSTSTITAYIGSCAGNPRAWNTLHPVYRPSGYYKLHVDYVSPANNQIRFRMYDGVNNWDGQPLAFTSSNDPIVDYLPVGSNATQIEPMVCNLSGSLNPLQVFLQVTLVPNYFRVTSKIIKASATATPQTFSYRYDGAASNDLDHSAAVKANNNPDLLYSPAFSEYRGNASASETGPDGKVTTTYFHQDDALKGQPSVTMVQTQSLFDAFEGSLDTTHWAYSGAAPVLERFQGDQSVRIDYQSPNHAFYRTSTGNDAGYTLSGSMVATIEFYTDASTTNNVVLAVNTGKSTENYQRWGIRYKGSAIYLHTDCLSMAECDNPNRSESTTLVGGVVDKTWYVLQLFVEGVAGNWHLRLRVYPREAPELRVQYDRTITNDNGTAWRFMEKTYAGTIRLDEYSEGRVYTEQNTFYDNDSDAPVVMDATLGPHQWPSGSAFQDLKIIWTRTVKTKTFNFEGSSNFAATQTEYFYNASLQGSTQFGNLTNTIESGWNGTTWVVYRGTQSEFFPFTSGVYLVSLAAYQKQYSCSSSCSFVDANLIAWIDYRYDNHANNSDLPTYGQITAKRILLHWDGSSPKFSDETYGYDVWGNQTSVTKYRDEGTVSAIATTGAETTTTCYGLLGGSPSSPVCTDDGYHIYPGWQQDAVHNPVTSWVYDMTNGMPTQETDANGQITTASYDGYGRLTKIIRPGDSVNSPTILINYNVPPGGGTYFWTEVSLKLDTSTHDTIRKFYDGLGQLIQTQTVMAKVNGTDKDIVTDYTYTYNAYGRIFTQSVPYPITSGSNYHSPNPPYTTQTQYDIIGRQTSITAPDSTNVTFGYSIDPTSGPGLKIDQKDALNYHTYTIQDVWGRTNTITPPAGPAITYGYDELNELTSATRSGVTSSMTYDFAGRKMTMSDPDMGNWSYFYDAANNLIKQYDANHEYTCLYYDIDNRPVGKFYQTSSACPASPTYAVSYTYDTGTYGKGHRTSMSYPGSPTSVTTSWTYDARGRMASMTEALDNKSYTTSWTYNPADQVASMTYPTYTNGTAETVTYTYLNQLSINTITAGSDLIVSNTTYDEAGRLLTRYLMNNTAALRTAYTYFGWNSQGGRLEFIKSGTAANNTSVQNLTYGYDGNGNITSWTDTKASESLTFSYDPANRLDYVSGAYTDDPGYDGTTGNLASKSGTSLSYLAQNSGCPNGALTKAHAVTTAGSNTYCYDPNGNMVRRTIGGVTYTLTYDYENRLTGVSGGSVTASFVYDGDGNRVKGVVNGTTTYYVSNYFETSETLATTKSYYYEGSTQVAMRQNGLITYLFSDKLGSNTYAADVNGSFQFEVRYKDWGEQRATGGTVTTSKRYTNQVDDGIGLYFYNARFYDSALGRFVSADSVVSNTYDPQDWDRYAYVHNSPVRYNDPTGHCPFCIIMAVAFIAAVILPWISSDTAPVGQPYKPETPEQFSADVSQRMDASATILSTGLIVGGAVQALSSGTGDTVNPNNPNRIGSWGEQ